MLLRNLNLIDGDGKRLPAGDIRLRDGRIAAIGPGLPADPGEDQLDLAGKTALPGYFNVHTHICLDGTPDPIASLMRDSAAEIAVKTAQRVAKALRAGVTGMRDAGGALHVDLAIKRMIDEGVIRGPFMQASGRPICMTGGHGHHFGHEADGPEEVRKAVRQELKAGASVIKVIATGGLMTEGTAPGQVQLNEDELRAAVQEAHKAGRKVLAHAEGEQGILNAVRAGVDSIEHGYWMSDEAIELMLERGTVYSPTLTADVRLAEYGREAGIPASVIDKLEPCLDVLYDSFGRAARAGVPIACGTDSGTAYNPPEDTPAEFELMVRHGLSPERALASIGVSARLMGLEDRGFLRPGMRGDIVILDGDPLTDIRNTWKVQMVFQAGVPVGSE